MLEPITAVSVMLGKELLKKFVNTSVDLSVEKIKAEAKKEGKDITDEQAQQILNYVKEQKNTQVNDHSNTNKTFINSGNGVQLNDTVGTLNLTINNNSVNEESNNTKKP